LVDKIVGNAALGVPGLRTDVKSHSRNAEGGVPYAKIQRLFIDYLLVQLPWGSECFPLTIKIFYDIMVARIMYFFRIEVS